MKRLVATIVDTADGMVRGLLGQRLCAFCQRWAKHPYSVNDLYFCDRIHASIHIKKQQEALKQALDKSDKVGKST